MIGIIASIGLQFFFIPAFAAEPLYTLAQGSAWNITQANGEIIRSPDKICKGKVCYLLPLASPAYLSIEHTYELRQIDFDHLASLASVKTSGDRLELPSKLGAQLYAIAHRESVRDLFDD